MMDTNQVPTYILDTSFLRRMQDQSFWTVRAIEQIKTRQPTILIPDGVHEEWEIYQRRHSDKKLLDAREIVSIVTGQEDISSSKHTPTCELSNKFDDELSEVGLIRKLLSPTDKTIMAAAYSIAKERKPVVIVTRDEGIHVQTQNAWVNDGLDITSISPWSKPAPIDRQMLIYEKVFENISQMAIDSPDQPRYLAVANNQNFGPLQFNIAFGWYINKTYQFTPPKIEGVSYIRVYEHPFRTSVENLRLHSLKNFGFYNADNHTQMSLITNKTPISMSEIQRRSQRLIQQEVKRIKRKHTSFVSIAVQIDYECSDIEWARVETIELKCHNKETLGKLEEFTRKLAGCK